MLKRLSLAILIFVVGPVVGFADDDSSPYAVCDSGHADCVQSAEDAYDACLHRCTNNACNDRCEARVDSRNDSCESSLKICRQAKDDEINSRLQLAPSGRISRFGQSDSNSGWQRFNCIASGGTNC